MTIIEIWALTLIYAVDEPYHRPSPAYDDAVRRHLWNGLIKHHSRSATGYVVTPKGEVVVAKLKMVEP